MICCFSLIARRTDGLKNENNWPVASLRLFLINDEHLAEIQNNINILPQSKTSAPSEKGRIDKSREKIFDGQDSPTGTKEYSTAVSQSDDILKTSDHLSEKLDTCHFNVIQNKS